MELSNRKIIIGIIIVLIAVVYGYIFFERYITESTITIDVLNKAQLGNESSEYLVFTKDEVFEVVNNSYQNATNAGEIYDKLKIGSRYKVHVVGFYLPSIPHFRNIVLIERGGNRFGSTDE